MASIDVRIRRKGGEKSADDEMRETSEKGGAGAEPDHWIGVYSRPTFQAIDYIFN